MRLSAKTLQEFKDICRDEFGLELSDAEAEVHALRVLELFWLVYIESGPPDAPPEASNDVDRAP